MSMVRRASLPVANNNGSRREGLRTKTPSVNDLSKKFKNAPRGKRRLEFQPKQPLKDKKFYLDLHGYKKISSLTARIKELGGKVEEFFNKDISYLITNRKDADSRLSPRSNSTPSPGMSVPSPFPINKSSSIRGSAWPSPLSADSPQSVDAHQTVPKHDTRGKTLQKQARLMSTTKFGTSNVLTNAKSWGISVVHIDKVLEKLAEYGPSKAQKQPSIKELRCGKKELRVEIRKLQVPFIKVEDQSRHYQPLVKEFKEWPLPDFNTPIGTCPFDSPKKKKEAEPKRKNKEKDNHNQDVKKPNKKGYCECCCLHYDALDLHLKSDHHKAFAKSDSNYDSLDRLISQGPSLRLFLDKVKLKYSRSESTEPISENKVVDPFQTPTKEPVNSIDDTIDKEMNENINENLIADREDGNQNDVKDREADNLHIGGSNGVKENSQAPETMKQEGSEGMPRNRITRNHLPYEDDVSETNNDPKTESNSHNLSIKQTTSDHLRHADCKHENLKIVVEDIVSNQKATSPDPSGMSEEKVDEQDENDNQERLSSQKPDAAVSFTSLKLHKNEDLDEGNIRLTRSQKKSTCSSDSTGENEVEKRALKEQSKNSDSVDGDENDVAKLALRGQRKNSDSVDGDEKDFPKLALREQRKNSDSADGDENDVPKLALRGQRKNSESTDGDENDLPKLALRGQRKNSDSADGDENDVPKRALRGQRKNSDSADGDENDVHKRALRSQRKINYNLNSTDRDEKEKSRKKLRSQRKINYCPDSTDGDENEESRRELRNQRKTNGSSDSTESLTSREVMTHLPPKRNFRSSNASSTDSLSERGITTDDNQDSDRGTRSKDGSKPLKRNGIAKDNFSEIRKNQEEYDKNESVEVKENFSSPKSGLSGSKRRDSPSNETLSSDDEYEDSDGSTEARAGSSLSIPKLPRSIWSKLPKITTQENHQNPPDSRNEALEEHANDEAGEQGLDEIVKMNDDAFTALFDSDNDDDKSFDGFDVPHFEGSKSSEQDLTYHIKTIVEYFTESQDDTLVNTTNEEVDDEGQEERSGPTDGTEKQMKKKKRQPHGIKIILSSKTDDGDDNVFEDEDEDYDDDDEEDDCDDEEEDSDNDDSSSTVADSSEGEEDELLSSSALCMDSITYKRKSWNLDDDEICFQVPSKRRRTTTDEDSSTHLVDDRERAVDQVDSDAESKRTTRTSTRSSSTKEKSSGVRETRQNARASTSLSSTKEKSSDNKRNGHAIMENSNRETRRNARASTRTSKSNTKIANQQSDGEDVTMEDVSQEECSKDKGRKTRASSRNSNSKDKSADNNKENCAAKMEDEYEKDRSKNTRHKTRAIKMSNAEDKNIDADALTLVKENKKKETRRKTRSSERASYTKESISDNSEDIGGNEEHRGKTRASSTSTKEIEVEHIEDHSLNDDPCPKRVTRRQGETGGGPLKRNDCQIKTKTNATREKKENNKQRASDNEVSSSKSNDVTNNDSLSSSGFVDISCIDSSFLKDLPQEVLDCLAVHMTIEERVKLRASRNKINSEPLPVRRNTNEKRKGDLKEKRDIQTAPSKKNDINTESTNTAQVSNISRLRSRSLNQDVRNSRLIKSRSVGATSSVASPPQKKPLCSASSSRDTSPLTTPIRTDKHWIFKPGHFSSSTPQPFRKVKSRTSPKTGNKLMTTRELRNTNKCLVPGDSYEFLDEDVFAFDD